MTAAVEKLGERARARGYRWLLAMAKTDDSPIIRAYRRNCFEVVGIVRVRRRLGIYRITSEAAPPDD